MEAHENEWPDLHQEGRRLRCAGRRDGQTLADEEGRRRLDNREDFVRVEVGTALKRGVRVILVLVEGALMPQASQLPEDLKPLARRNALSVSHDRFRADSERLIDSVGEVLEAARVE